jgi:hypothetical protein
MGAQGKSSKDSKKTAYICHVFLAVIFALALAMQIHLWAIDAKGDVIGAGFFLVVIWLGLPAAILAILAIYFSWKAFDSWLLWLVVALAAPVLGLLFDASMLLMVIFQALYVALVSAVGLLWKLRRGDEISN